MWRSGQDMSPFDDVANLLLNTAPDSEANWATVDRGYAVLEQMLANPRYISEVPGRAEDRQTSINDWPYYGGAAGFNTGYSSDVGPLEGEFAWRFPKGFSWNVVPVLEDGKIYVSSPGIDVVGFCIDENTGKVIWRARQHGERFQGKWRHCRGG